MVWLSRLFSSLLVLTLTAAIFSIVLNQTVFNSQYLENKLQTTNSYSRLSTAISDQVARDAGLASPTLASQLKAVITPEVVQTRLNGTIDQFQAYYRGDGPMPTVDLTDIGSKLQAVGVPIGSDSPLAKPITLGSNPDSSTNPSRQAHNNPQRYQLISVVASIVLAGLLGLVCWRRRNYLPFSRVLISIGITTGIIALLCLFVPGIIDHAVKFSAASNVFAGVVHDVAVAIAHDLDRRFGIIALSALVLGIGSHILLRRHMREQLRAVMTPRPSPARLSR